MPARYIGNELNSARKEWANTSFKVALAYPDTYEIGMSNLGIQILYHIMNRQAGILAERVFAPWPDMEYQLTTNNLQLTTLESFKPLSDFDLIGFSLGHELTYTNICNILKLGGVPIRSSERGEKDPLVLGGGPCVFNPEPIADFFDFFVIGEAEEIIVKITELLRDSRHETRDSRLKKLSQIPGIYIPQLKNKVVKQHITDLNSVPYPTKPIIPYISAIHDRAVLEIMRGCKWGCKFCQASWTTRPVRQKDMDKLLQTADELLKNTGYEEISLVSLSSSDYQQIEELAKTLAQKYAEKRVNVSLPSLRAGSLSVKLTKAISRVRPSGLTIAPEAGTQRLRDIIGKKLTEETIIEGVTSAFSEGIQSIKLYFMIGLPTETQEDLFGICELAKKILAIGKSKTGRVRVTVNLATFIPKAHTPFQWDKQVSIDEAIEKQNLIKYNLKVKGIEVKWHLAEASFLEGVFARGDRQLSQVIAKAWELGARLDAWSEHIKFDIWQKAFAECGIDPNEYLASRPKEQPLPWDYIDTGVPKQVLIKQSGRPTPKEKKD